MRESAEIRLLREDHEKLKMQYRVRGEVIEQLRGKIGAFDQMHDALRQCRDLFEDDEGISAVIDAAIAKAEGRS